MPFDEENVIIIKLGNSEFYFSRIGAMLIGWNHGKNEVIPSIEQKSHGGTSLRGGMPICLPFFGESPFDMKSISQHGWLRNQIFSDPKVVEKSSNEKIITYSGESDTSQEYPWKLQYNIMYECRDGEILTTLQVSHNDVGLSDNTPAPVNIALHPYFTTVRTSVSVGPHIARFSDEFYDITYCEGNPITIPTPAGDIVMELGDEYAMLRFWSDNPQKYRCVEPVMGDTSEFNTMRGISIKAGETLTISMRMILR